MKQDVTTIQESLKNDSLSIGELGKAYTTLAGWYSYYAQMLKEVRLEKPAKWLEIKKTRPEHDHTKDYPNCCLLEKPLSDTHTDRLWEATEDGKKEIALEWELKKIEQLTRAIKARLYVSEQEAHNNY